MNMEGTKHEKAVILFLAYVVGFTSGFIAFGTKQSAPEVVSVTEVVQEISLEESPDVVEEVITDDVLTEAVESPNEYSNPLHPEGTHAYYQNGRLLVSVNGQVTLLSMEKNRMAANVTDLFSKQGSHIAIPHTAVSTDNKYVYFCEQQSDADSCVSFVYAIEAQTIYSVMDNGQKVVMSGSDAKKVTWDGNKLSVGTSLSTSPEAPWKVAAR